MIKTLIGLLLLISSQAAALPILGEHWFEIGPQISHWHLKCYDVPKHGNAILYGGYFKYDRLKGNSLYWGAEGSFSEGRIYYSIPKIHGSLSQQDIQGKLGVTLNIPLCFDLFSFSPFVGIGDSRQKESHPSVPTFYDHYTFLSAGFQSRLNLTEQICIGLNCQLHSIWFFTPFLKEIQVETPILIGKYPLFCASVGLNVTPYYQYRDGILRYTKTSSILHFSSSTNNIFGVRLGLFVHF